MDINQSSSSTSGDFDHGSPDELLHHAIEIGNLDEVANQLKRGANINARNQKAHTPLDWALLHKQTECAAFLIDRGCDCRAAMAEGPYKGFTSLHFAVMQDDDYIVFKLIYICNVDVNAVADDGTQPIHLAFLKYSNEGPRFNPFKQLLKNGADANATFDKFIFDRYFNSSNNIQWTGEFGEKIPLIALVISQKINLVAVFNLIEYGAKVNLKNRDNVTLLMMAASGQSSYIVSEIIPKLSKEEINCRDNYGYSAVHYLVHPSLFGKYRYNIDQLQWRSMRAKNEMLIELEKAGADLNARVNGDPKTLLINTVAYRALHKLASFFEPSYRISAENKPLYYSMIPDHVDQALKDYSENITSSDESDFHHNQEHSDFAPSTSVKDLKTIQESKKETVKAIVHSLLTRQIMHVPVVTEELNMINIILEKEIISKEDFELIQNSVHMGIWDLNQIYIAYGDELNSYKEIEYLSDKQLRELVRNKLFFKAFLAQEFTRDSEPLCYFVSRFNEIAIRPELLNKFKSISFIVIRALYLPYDCLLNILCYLNNIEFDNFINAFVIYDDNVDTAEDITVDNIVRNYHRLRMMKTKAS